MGSAHRIARPDGVELAVERRGAGPVVLLTVPFFSPLAVYEPLAEALAAAGHTVVGYEPRGSGASTRAGPFDGPTDYGDYEAVARAEGPVAAAVGLGYGLNCAIRVCAAAPELVAAVVTPAGTPLSWSRVGDTEGLAGSESVVAMMLELARSDFRSFMRATISSTNPQLDEDEIRERVEQTLDWSSREAIMGRLNTWLDDDIADEARVAGDRLWILAHPNNPWFTPDLLERTRQEFPEAHVQEVDDGPLSRPDITVDVVSRITSRVPQ